MTDVTPGRPAGATRTLVLVRHAKTETVAVGGGGDRARALTERGHRDAAALGSWLAVQGIDPDLAVVSPAVRARETWEDLADELDDPPQAEYEDDLYDADLDLLLGVVTDLPDDCPTVVLVGHAPGIPALAEAFVEDGEGGGGEPAALEALAEHYPTNGVAVVRFSGEAAASWEAVAPGTGWLVAFEAPRG